MQRHFPPPMYVQFDGHVNVTPPELLHNEADAVKRLFAKQDARPGA